MSLMIRIGLVIGFLSGLVACGEGARDDVLIASPVFPQVMNYTDQIRVSFNYYGANDDSSDEKTIKITCDFKWATPVTEATKLDGTCPPIVLGTYQYHLAYYEKTNDLLLAEALDQVDINKNKTIRIVPTLNIEIDSDNDGVTNLDDFLSRVNPLLDDVSEPVPPSPTPTANAGSNQSIKLGTPVTLNGNDSLDPQGDGLTFAWTLTKTPSGSTASLSDPTSVSPMITPDIIGEYQVKLIVSDRTNESASDTMSIQVTDVENLPPIADAGTSGEVTSGNNVILDGSDSDGDIVSYDWVSEDSSISLTGSNTATPSFTAPTVSESTAYSFKLTVTDDDGVSTSDTVVITVVPLGQNKAPIADAGTSREMELGEKVILDGSNSSDSDGEIVSYGWVSEDSSISLTDPNTATPSFTAPTVSASTDYGFVLTVTDDDDASAADTVVITILPLRQNEVPIADAGTSREMEAGEKVSLEGSKSNDSDGNIVSYGWISEDNRISLTDPNTATPSFTAPAVSESTNYGFELTVTDDEGASTTDTVVITVILPRENKVPVAIIIADKTTVALGDTITLDASQSSDLNQDSLTYQWKVTSNADNSSVLPSSRENVTTTFTPDVVGSYIMELSVSDGALSDTATLSLTAIPAGRFPQPEMVKIPGGNFQMGGSWGSPVHKVTIADFELSQYEVTVGQFRAFVEAVGYVSKAEEMGDTGENEGCFIAGGEAGREKQVDKSWQAPNFTQTDNDPVVCVSWEDAKAYIAWLKERTGLSRYRLPSEAEWEYAARVGTTYNWETRINLGEANYQGAFVIATRDVYLNTAPIGHFSANFFGLYDMHGNVAEWVEDCWNSNYTGAPTDGSAWEGGNCSYAMLRGGSWNSNPNRLSSDYRTYQPINISDNVNGFRVARTFDPDNIQANAGSNQSLRLDTLDTPVTLNGSGSLNTKGNGLTFAWTLSKTPDDSTASLSDPSVVSPTIIPDIVGEYQVQLIVNNGTNNSAPDNMSIQVASVNAENLPPIADVGITREVESGHKIILTGDNSNDSDGNIASYAWISEDSSISLSLPDTAITTFIAPTVSASTDYRFELTVTDDTDASAADTVVITVVPRNEVLTAIAMADKTTVTLGDTITLDASQSSDPNQDNLTYQWQVMFSPDNSSVLPSSPTDVITTFTPDTVGNYRLVLSVSDGVLNDTATLHLAAISAENFPQPTMVKIPRGSFQRGSVTVTIADFELSQYEVTVDQFRTFVDDTNYVTDAEKTTEGCKVFDDGTSEEKPTNKSWQDPNFTQTDNDPVVCVSWKDAKTYVAWLNLRTGLNRYRLPSEAEWEYAARAGTTTLYHWGTRIDHGDANYEGTSFIGDTYLNTGPVGHFPANFFGLYDMHGNVAEWVEDCWNNSNYPRDAPTDGSAWEEGNCGYAMLRGGSWNSKSWSLSSASRTYQSISISDNVNGFRVARTP